MENLYCYLMLASVLLYTHKAWVEKFSLRGKMYLNLYVVIYMVNCWDEQDVKTEQGEWWRAVLRHQIDM